MRMTQIDLTPEQIEALGAELEAVEHRMRAKLGAEDAAYIRKIIKISRTLDASGRALLLASLFPPAWFAGTAMLGVAKILDNMEVGHNVMHGQYDFMNDPVINTKYEWDNVSDGEQWRHSHNYVHHTFTNVLGVDHDIGYRLVRMSKHQPWHPRWVPNLLNTFLLASLFEWGVGVHDFNIADAFMEANPSRLEFDKLVPFLKKMSQQLAKDYVLFPALSGPMAPAVLLGNLGANLIRNYWAWAVIFLGHFPEGTALFPKEQLENETRGQWYLRQVLGSSNIDGGTLMNVMTGHLSHQIEHHLYPTIPAWRYPEMAKEVRVIAKKYGIPYNSGSFVGQMASVLKQIAQLSLPSSLDEVLNFRANDKAMQAAKEAGRRIIRGEHLHKGQLPADSASRSGGVARLPGLVAKALRKGASRLRSAA
jgi:fatty acid desaturase